MGQTAVFIRAGIQPDYNQKGNNKSYKIQTIKYKILVLFLTIDCKYGQLEYKKTSDKQVIQILFYEEKQLMPQVLAFSLM